LAYSAQIISMKYDMIITMPDGLSQTYTVWYENNKMRMEMTAQGETIIVLPDLDAGTMYMYYPSQNIAMKVTYDPEETALDETEGITDYDPTVLGTETLDGKICVVVEYTYEDTYTKMWIWKKYGFPIRIEATSSEGLTVMEYKNISFEDIDDDLFVLPDGVEIMDLSGY
jgi:outer membrane lipoprotein-sorting protein